LEASTKIAGRDKIDKFQTRKKLILSKLFGQIFPYGGGLIVTFKC